MWDEKCECECEAERCECEAERCECEVRGVNVSVRLRSALSQKCCVIPSMTHVCGFTP